MWCQIEVVEKNVYRVHVKIWHPGFWAFVYRALRKHGSRRLEAVWLTAKCIWTLR